MKRGEAIKCLLPAPAVIPRECALDLPVSENALVRNGANAMFRTKTDLLRHLRVAALLFTFILLVIALQAQTASTPSDPGVRPTGKEQLNTDPNAVCPVVGSKFRETACIDFVQPPSVPPAPPADGAGQILANAGNLGGTWFQALTVFSTPASVNGTDNSGKAGQFIKGLGPSFNAESCFQCHSQPAVGGSSPGCVGTFCSELTPTVKFSSTTNPQIVAAGDRNANNSIPELLIDRQPTGPLVEVRFPRGAPAVANAAAVQPGAVAELFVIAGRTDAPAGCAIDQEDFQTQETNGNTVFRIPIPTFGDGFVENAPKPGLVNNANAAKAAAAKLGITGIDFGVFNLSGNDQTITRFGWKAQNKSLLILSGEASNVEMGVTNELFPTERTYGNFPGCTNVNQLPEDVTQSLDSTQIINIEGPPQPPPAHTGEPGVTSVTVSGIENDAIFMRLNGAPSICNWNSGVNATTGFANCNKVDSTVIDGANIFGTTILGPAATVGLPNIGCALCPSATLTTGPSTTPSLNNATFHPFSDFALHHMGGLADGVSQGAAGGDQFRTAPLWGLGQRLFFLHDGRDNNLIQTIKDHCIVPAAGIVASEACEVVSKFNSQHLYSRIF
jgi:CxxC motif-containing protein (DUF1111 family)